MVVSLVNRLPAPTEFFALLETWFQNKRFDESALQDMLFLLDDVISKDPVFVDTVAKLYLRCKPPGYSFSRGTVSWLVYVHARAGSKDSAKEWIDPERHAGASSPNPYTSLLRFVDGSSGDDELYLWIIQRMREFQIQPDLPFYNALLFAEFARRRYEHAFKIYALLKSSDDPAVTPDGLTFTTLFRVQLDMSRPDTQRMRSMPGAPSPRQLYREMIACHVSRTDNGLEGTLTDSTLVLALRVFMKRRDYAAAFVALKTIQHCKMPIDLEMYHRILAFLMQRIEQQLSSVAVRRGPRSSWSYRFLGLATAPTKQRPVYDPRVLDAVLRIGMIRRLSLDYVAPQLELTDDDPPEERPDFDAPAGSSTHKQSAPTRSPKLPESSFDFETYTKAFRIHGMPTTLDVTGTVKSNPRRIYSATPLERILRRAMLADRPASIVAAMKDVNTELAMAKEQMLGDLKNKLSRSSAGKQKRRDVDRSGSKKQADGAASGRAGDNAVEADG
ncbi:hypothetical protein EVJ58_g1576 [Rhodofomes roseus]|uniref:Uncharacterized protein n=1 Tax=Rhodofomes roseus TaxID=34475 RepID=A0A4Y9Z0I6_9APHY|nr:hypothetical protein EVJ58_g1576 [Rhodofomes roseus]